MVLRYVVVEFVCVKRCVVVDGEMEERGRITASRIPRN